jgi:hypothetical protein
VPDHVSASVQKLVIPVRDCSSILLLFVRMKSKGLSFEDEIRNGPILPYSQSAPEPNQKKFGHRKSDSSVGTSLSTHSAATLRRATTHSGALTLPACYYHRVVDASDEIRKSLHQLHVQRKKQQAQKMLSIFMGTREPLGVWQGKATSWQVRGELDLSKTVEEPATMLDLLSWFREPAVRLASKCLVLARSVR